jgi:hypothetical protein
MTVMPSPMLTDRFSRAFEFASVVHATQVRKGTRIPYLSHLLAVASLVIEHGADEDTAIAALLHDAPEDRGGKPMLEQIRARFGKRVADTVHGCTDTFEKKKGPYAERKTRYVEHLAGDASEATCLVSAADKLHNARSILHDLRAAKDVPGFWTRFGSTPAQSGWYYGRVEVALARRLAGHDGREMVTEIHRALDGIAETDGCASFASGLTLGRAGEACPPDQSESGGAPA